MLHLRAPLSRSFLGIYQYLSPRISYRSGQAFLSLSLYTSQTAYPLVCSSLSPVALSGAVEALCSCLFPCAHAILLVLYFLRTSRLPQTHSCLMFVSFQCLSLLLPRHFDPVLPSPHCRYTACTCRSVVACSSSQEKHSNVASVHVLCCTKASQYACTACSITSCAFVLCLQPCSVSLCGTFTGQTFHFRKHSPAQHQAKMHSPCAIRNTFMCFTEEQ